MKFTKTGWFKTIFTLVALMFCMSVLCFPALATELDLDPEQALGTESPSDYDEVISLTDIGELGDMLTELFGEQVDTLEYDETGATGGSGYRPFTPSGTATVVDNATGDDGKEFFTIKTDDDDIFYLVIDRQRNTENVYFLNTVTVSDLMALAEKNGTTINAGGSSLPPPAEQPGTGGIDEPAPASPEPEDPESGSKTTTYIIVGIVLVAVGGAGVYFKVIKGKKNSADDDDYEDEYGYGGDQDNSDEKAEDGDDADV